jgi:hypothetical protein
VLGSAVGEGRLVHRWQATRLGHVTAIAMGPGGCGALWTGTSRGYLRVWEFDPDSGGSSQIRGADGWGEPQPAVLPAYMSACQPD